MDRFSISMAMASPDQLELEPRDTTPLMVTQTCTGSSSVVYGVLSLPAAAVLGPNKFLVVRIREFVPPVTWPLGAK